MLLVRGNLGIAGKRGKKGSSSRLSSGGRGGCSAPLLRNLTLTAACLKRLRHQQQPQRLHQQRQRLEGERQRPASA